MYRNLFYCIFVLIKFVNTIYTVFTGILRLLRFHLLSNCCQHAIIDKIARRIACKERMSCGSFFIYAALSLIVCFSQCVEK